MGIIDYYFRPRPCHCRFPLPNLGDIIYEKTSQNNPIFAKVNANLLTFTTFSLQFTVLRTIIKVLQFLQNQFFPYFFLNQRSSKIQNILNFQSQFARKYRKI